MELDEFDLLTENLREILKEGLESFVKLVTEDANIKGRFNETQHKQLQELLTKCRLADTDIVSEQGTKVALLQRFSNKRVNHMPKYVKELLHLDNQVRQDKKFLKRIFEDKPKYYHFLRDNLAWMLEKTHYDFTKDEVLGLIGFISKNAKVLVQDNKEFPKKFHDLL